MSLRLASWIVVCGLIACLPESSDLSGYSRDWEPLDPSAGGAQANVGGVGGGASAVGGSANGGAAPLAGSGGTEGLGTPPLTPPSETGGSTTSGGGAGGSESQASGGAAGTDSLGDGGTSSEPPIEPPPDVPTCDVGVLSPDETTCLFVSTSVASWQAARDACNAQQSSLAKVESTAEDALINSMIFENAWLGASDVLVDNTYVWLDGSPVTFGNWGPSQPDRFPGADCIEKRVADGGLWFDQPCFNERLFVCEKPSSNG